MSNEKRVSSEGGVPDLIASGALVVEGRRIPLLGGEVQFFRMDPGSWENALRNLGGAGLPMVSTYLSWRRFSLGPDRYDLEGATDPRLDVRRFLDLCVKLGLWVTMKPGPWICAEETNGGYPDWLVAKEELQVLDAADRPVRGYNPPFQSPIPSYLHPVYLDHVRRWIERVDTALAGYFFPRGPILLVQLDNEPSYTFHDGILESDYNPVNVGAGGLYARWLERRYGRIEELNRAHGSDWSTFSDVAAPRTASIGARGGLAHLADWVAFKEDLLVRHVEAIRRMHLDNGVDGVLFTINYNLHRQLAVPADWSALERSSGMGGFDYYPRMPVDERALAEVALHVGYSRVCNALPWSPEIMCGTWSYPGQAHVPGGHPPADFEYLYLSCVAFGLKGMNFYMFADRDNWIDSPVDAAGEVRANAAAVRRVVALLRDEPGFERMERRQPVGVLYYRPAARESFVADALGPAASAASKTGTSYGLFVSLFNELHGMNLDPAVVDPWVEPSAAEARRILFSPWYDGMDATTLEALDAAVRRGVTLVWVGERLPMDPGTVRGHPCLRTESITDAGRIDLLRLCERAGVHPEVTASIDGVLTFVHHLPERAWLFVVNATGVQHDVTLSFSDALTKTLVALPTRDRTLRVAAARASVFCAPRSVQVWETVPE